MRQLGAGEEFAGYRIEGVAGRGGMGLVYRARQRRPERLVAIKVIAPELAADPSFRARFEQESASAAEIEHPNVIPVYEVGEDDGLLFISMRFVQGVDLKRHLQQEGRLEPKQAAGIVAQVASALDAAHARGLVHRDVKPGNILLAERDHVYLTDFGLTKRIADSRGMTRTGLLVGTVDYLAPEQIEGGRVDARADVYALGCVTYELLSGRVPFPRDSDLAKMFAHVRDPPPHPAGVPAPLVDAVARAMAKNPADRFLSAGDLGRAVLAGAAGQAPSGSDRTVAVGKAAIVDEAATQLAPTRLAAAAGAPPAGSSIAQQTPPAGTQAAGPGQSVAARRGAFRRWPILLAVAGGLVAVAVAVVVIASGRAPGNERNPGNGRGRKHLQQPSTTGRSPVAGAIPVGNSPDGIRINQGSVWVANAGDSTITRINQQSGQVLGTFSYASHSQPAAPIAHWKDALWVGDSRDGTIRKVDPISGKVIGAPIPVGGDPCAITVASGAMWVANYNDTVVRIVMGSGSAGSFAPTQSVIHLASGPKRMTSLDDAMWVANSSNGTVTKISASNGQLLSTLSVGGHPGGISGSQGNLWLTDPTRNTVTRINPTSGKPVGSPIRVGGHPGRMTESAGSVWVADSANGTVTRIDATTGRILAEVRVGGHPDAMAEQDGVVWVGVWNQARSQYHGAPGSVVRINESNGTVIQG